MSPVFDLHCHSTASDGALSPAELLMRAKDKGVSVLALTDHDTTFGLEAAAASAEQLGICLLNGIEVSALYANQCLHVIGLDIDPKHPVLAAGLARQSELRGQRARKMAEKLAKKGIADAYPAVRALASTGEITRSHFANFLVQAGKAKDQQDAFDKYLSKGKPGYVPTQWAELDEVVAWINAAGGVAVLAHPLRYNLSHKWIDRVLAAFKQVGGVGVEVVTGRSSPDDIRLSAQLALKHGLYASLGSDFHNPDNPWVELGKLAPLPAGLQPIWQLFGSAVQSLLP
ncbi:PHP domain-containing protein [Methylomonas rhizoryzae]|uniref:PHP domain-containing protein n=1 Tax=Methylomonas rhizoryzae TaxID=2608981 RepID=UPI001231C1A8|nr:PHP domain-containing protein [Methylomonas rhizoryzae]